ncbi:putative transcriptional regulator [Campylobacter sputorum subsp. bovis]|nr:putative transcriptional regulator [Campylobacter sputorum]
MLNLPQITTEKENEEFFKNIANNVKKKRIEKGFSQLETALSIGQASSGFYANMENNAHSKNLISFIF